MIVVPRELDYLDVVRRFELLETVCIAVFYPVCGSAQDAAAVDVFPHASLHDLFVVFDE